MIDPLIALAHSIYSNKGVYALLLGSGASRSAGILTGWEIVLNLTDRLAVLEGEERPKDPAAWFRAKFGQEPDYSQLLEALCKSQIERQQLLSGYFEPTEEEREVGDKSPSATHRAIASLVAKGYIKVIVTTNFDRLIEQALEEVGATPVVLSTTDSIRGAKPLVHQDCVVIKVHGDYKDPRIKNSPAELATYDVEVDAILDRIVDEYGFIVCGWSGEWDQALRAVFDRASNRRFPMYWVARSRPKGKAKDLADRRNAVFLQISDADSFFESVSSKVLALEEFAQPHPISVATASAMAKRFLSEPKYRIKLHELVRSETESSFESLQDEFKRKTYESDLKTALDRYWSITEILRSVCTNVVYFGKDSHELISSSLARLTNDPLDGESGAKIDFTLRSTASAMVLYVVGIAGCANNQIDQTLQAFKTPILRKYKDDEPLLTTIDWPTLHRIFQSAFPGRTSYFPASEWLYAKCRESMAPLVPDPAVFERQFNRFEMLISMVYLAIDPRQLRGGRAWAPLGTFAYQHTNGNSKFLEKIVDDSAIVDALISTRIYLSKPDIYKARDTLISLITERNLW